MRKIEFKLDETSRSNKVFIFLEYMSGDADAYETEEIELKDITYENYKEHIDTIEKEFKFYSTLKDLLDEKSGVNKGSELYDEILEKHGEDMADAYDNVPGDSTVDGQFPAALSDIELIAYDNKGTKYKSYL